ncbi:hypothetical protein ACE6H2_004241 [Prunus campanulata]
MSSQSKVQYSLGKVPFSWENKPGVSKATQPPHPYRELPPPPCPCGEAPPKLSLQDFHLPLPPCTFQPLSRSSSTKALNKHEDPFLVAFQECTKPPEEKAKDKTTSSNKYRFRSGLGSWFGFGLSCKQSSSVRDDSLVRVSRVPYQRDRPL